MARTKQTARRGVSKAQSHEHLLDSLKAQLFRALAELKDMRKRSETKEKMDAKRKQIKDLNERIRKL